MRSLVVVVLMIGCMRSQAVDCGDGRICPAGTVCDNLHDRCIGPEQLRTCIGIANGMSCTIDVFDDGICDREVCLHSTCGDGYRRGEEACDGEELGARLDCTDLGFYVSRPLSCNSACSYDDSLCEGKCGDGIVTTGHELCDGAPPAKSCVDLGYGAGFLDCAMCGPGLLDCHVFGWSRLLTAALLRDVHGTDAANVFAAGGLDLMRYDGATWTEVDISACNSTTQLSSVWTIGPHEAFVGLYSGGVLHVTPTGCTPATADPGDAGILDVWASDSTAAYAVGGNGIFRLSGSSWTQVSTVARRVIWGSGAADVYAGGNDGTLMRFNGTSWSTPTALGSLTTITAIWGTSATDVYVIGAAGSDGVVMHYNGAWSPILSLPNATLDSGWSAGDFVYVGGAAAGKGFVLARAGDEWTNLVPETEHPVHGLWASTGGTVHALPDAFFGTRVLLTFEGTTRIDDDIGANLFALDGAVRNANEAYMVMAPFGVFGDVYEWDGVAWTLTSQLTNAGGVWIDPLGVPNAVTETGGIFRRDGTGTWNPVTGTPSGYEVWGAAANDLWVITEGPNPPSDHRLVHWNGSQTSLCATCTVIPRLRDIWGSATNNIYAVGDDGLILHWTGSAWSSVAVTNKLLFGVWGSGPSDVYAVGLAGTVAHYDGSTWTVTTPIGAAMLVAVWGGGPTDVFVSTNSGLVFHYDGQRWSPVRSGEQDGIFVGETVGATTFFGGKGTMHRLIRTVAW